MLDGEIDRKRARPRKASRMRECRRSRSPTSRRKSSPSRRKRHAFLAHFDGIVVSGHERLLKPDPRIFELFLHRYRRAAEQCIFIDDNEANVRVAGRLGMRTIHYSEMLDLGAALRALEPGWALAGARLELAKKSDRVPPSRRLVADRSRYDRASETQIRRWAYHMNEKLVPQGPAGISFDRPTLIAADNAPRFLWGDAEAGYVSDWIYGSSPSIHMMAFEMNVGARLRQLARLQDLSTTARKLITA